jgi:hypothetical protein
MDNTQTNEIDYDHDLTILVDFSDHIIYGVFDDEIQISGTVCTGTGDAWASNPCVIHTSLKQYKLAFNRYIKAKRERCASNLSGCGYGGCIDAYFFNILDESNINVFDKDKDEWVELAVPTYLVTKFYTECWFYDEATASILPNLAGKTSKFSGETWEIILDDASKNIN